MKTGQQVKMMGERSAYTVIALMGNTLWLQDRDKNLSQVDRAAVKPVKQKSQPAGIRSAFKTPFKNA